MGRGKRAVRENRIISLMLGLFITSLSLFVFQVILTRLLSPMFQYHYVFLLTSMAIFGSGLGGLITYRLGKKHTLENMKMKLPLWSSLLAVSYITAFVLIFKLPFMNFIFVYSALAIIPYIIGGAFISSVFRIVPSTSYRLYFADLFGSALGSIAVIYFLNNIGVANTVLIISGLVALSSLYMAIVMKRNKIVLIPLLLTIGISLIGSFQQSISSFESQFTGYLTSPTTTLATMRASNIDHSLVDTIWNAYSRTDLIERKDDQNSKVISMDGGANSMMLHFDGDLSKYQSLKKDLNYLPFAVGKQDNVLLIGPGGGKDVVFALLGGSKKIDAVEISAGSVEMVREYGDYNGNIYDRKDVNVYIQDGRNFVKETNQKYDNIYLAQVMTSSAETVGYALAENFIYTKEAIKDYWSALSQDGKISFILHDGQDLNRMVFTVIEALKELGIPREQIGQYITIINRENTGHQGNDAVHIPLLMIQKSPYSTEQINAIMKKVSEYNHSPLYIPNLTEGGPINSYVQGKLELSTVYQTLPINLVPTSDDRPFFFDYNKKVSSVLLLLLAGVVIIALLFYRPLAKEKKLRKSSLYFMGLGLAFMLIEIPLIQRYSLLLGHPTRSFVIIITAILLGSGIGSLVGGWKKFKWGNRYTPLLIVAVLTIVVHILSTMLINQWFISSLNARILITFITLLPLGFFMGMPFPFGLKALRTFGNEESIPLIWGLNGILSVGGSVLAVITSMKIGFTFTLGLGASIYLALFIFMPLYDRTK